MVGLKNSQQFILRLLITLVVTFLLNLWIGKPYFLISMIGCSMLFLAPGNFLYQGTLILLTSLVLVCLVAFFFSFNTFFLVKQVFIGGLAGLLINSFLLPKKAELLFKIHTLPLLKILATYFDLYRKALINGEVVTANIIEAIERPILHLPSFAFHIGFDERLKKGQQFFLIKLSQLLDVLQVLSLVSQKPIPIEIINPIKVKLEATGLQIQELFYSIINALEENVKPPVDFFADLQELEAAFWHYHPDAYQLLKDGPSYYKTLCQYIYCLMDLRKILLKMGQMLEQTDEKKPLLN